MLKLTKMRPPQPGEGFASRYILRPVIWFAWQFSSEARFFRKNATPEYWKRQREK